MSNKNLSTVTYAAGAGLAAIALVYVFAPTYVIDESSSSASHSHAVGLRNIGNDCFINSVLQALAGLGELRLYLIRETHRRAIDPDVYARNLVPPFVPDGAPPGKSPSEWQLRSLQSGAVTLGLKEILDSLNERSIYKKAISPRGFVGVLEAAFGQTINRQQQDAQEFLQLLVERLLDEYIAGKRARAHARKMGRLAAAGEIRDDMAEGATTEATEGEKMEDSAARAAGGPRIEEDEDEDEEHDFPMEGEREAQSQCQTCGFRTTPRKEVFCMLTLSVPQVSATSLDRCFDGLFKTEHIPDYKCDKCRLIHARDHLASDMHKSTSATFRDSAQRDLDSLQASIDHDPENPPRGVTLPDVEHAPRRTISRSHRITRFPRVLVVHLSRSIYDRTSQKNMAKVSFPEALKLGGLARQRRYKLLATVTHKGGHQSGHYQSFRRQAGAAAPFSNPHVSSGVYQSRAPSKAPSPSSSEAGVEPDPDAAAQSSEESSLAAARNGSGTTSAKDRSETSSLRSVAASAFSRISHTRNGAEKSQRAGETGAEVAGSASSKVTLNGNGAVKKPVRLKKKMWWRINDERCKSAKTAEVLGMEREVYLLFYELQPDESDS